MTSKQAPAGVPSFAPYEKTNTRSDPVVISNANPISLFDMDVDELLITEPSVFSGVYILSLCSPQFYYVGVNTHHLTVNRVALAKLTSPV